MKINPKAFKKIQNMWKKGGGRKPPCPPGSPLCPLNTYSLCAVVLNFETYPPHNAVPSTLATSHRALEKIKKYIIICLSSLYVYIKIINVVSSGSNRCTKRSCGCDHFAVCGIYKEFFPLHTLLNYSFVKC